MTPHQWAAFVAAKLGPPVHTDGVYAILWIHRERPLTGYSAMQRKADNFMEAIAPHPYMNRFWDEDKICLGLLQLLPNDIDRN